MSSQGNTTINTAFQAGSAADADDPPQVILSLQNFLCLLHSAQYTGQPFIEFNFAWNGG